MFTDYVVANYYYFRREIFGGPRPELEELNEAKGEFIAMLKDAVDEETLNSILPALENLIEFADLAGFHLATRYYYNLDHPDAL